MTFVFCPHCRNAFCYISCDLKVKVRKQWYSLGMRNLVTLSAVLIAQCSNRFHGTWNQDKGCCSVRLQIGKTIFSLIVWTLDSMYSRLSCWVFDCPPNWRNVHRSHLEPLFYLKSDKAETSVLRARSTCSQSTSRFVCSQLTSKVAD